ncbi:MAG: alanyl-tRNA editing protein [Burkholderiales bacterium]|jgi:misacylated tRNA(Ala) deacylase|nr:alanyl-tRNA editing protein [Burkholderiales bacterium]
MGTQALHREDATLAQCEAVVTAVGEDGVELDRTVFYPLGGGQAGDTGTLVLADGTRLPVIDTRKSKREGAGPDDSLHLLDPTSGWRERLAIGTPVRAEIDWQRRHSHMRLHTATHLLCAVVPAPVDGCSITAEYARLDFALTDPLAREDVQRGLDALIAKNASVTYEWITDEEMAANPQLVKSMSVKPPMGFGRVRLVRVQDVDLQPCGGTHVRNTGEIGALRVAKIEKKSARTRRVVLEFA